MQDQTSTSLWGSPLGWPHLAATRSWLSTIRIELSFQYGRLSTWMSVWAFLETTERVTSPSCGTPSSNTLTSAQKTPKFWMGMQLAYRLSVMPLKRQSKAAGRDWAVCWRHGRDEHIAFYKWAQSVVQDPCEDVAMDTILASARFFSGNLTKVPTMALTVGMGTDCHGAREVMILITGFLKRLLCTRPSKEEWTICGPCLSSHSIPTWVLIPTWWGCHLELKVKIIKYFREI